MTAVQFTRLVLTLGCVFHCVRTSMADSNDILGQVSLVTTTGVIAIEPGNSLTFEATATNSENAMFEFQLGDEAMISKCSGSTNVTQYTHQFDNYGNFTIEVTVNNNVSEVSALIDIYVLNPVTATLVLTPVAASLLTPVDRLTLNTAVSPTTQPLVASNVFCRMEYSGGDDILFIGDFDEAVSFDRNYDNFTTTTGPGEQEINVTCWNLFNEIFASTTVDVFLPISNLQLLPYETGKYEYPTGQNLSYLIAATDGEMGATYEINFGDGAIDIFCLDSHENFTVIHEYDVSGWYMAKVSARDDAIYMKASLTSQLLIQNPVGGLDLVADPSLVVYPLSGVNFTLDFTDADYFDVPPEEVTCDWSFADGSSSRSDYMGNLTANFSQEVEYFHPLKVDSKDHTTIVNCSNLVSFQVMALNVTVFAPLVNITITAVGLSTRFLIPFSVATFRVAALGGDSSVSYVIDFGDGDSYVMCAPYHEDFEVTHLYKEVGLYWPLVIGEDAVSVQRVALDGGPIHVQNPLQDIEVTPDYDGLIPVGKVVFMMDSTALDDPTNVTCNWTYPGGLYETNATDLTNVTTNVTKYFGAEAVGESVVDIYCWNLVSNATATVDLIFVARLIGLTITPEVADIAVDANVSLYINMEFGGNVTYEVDFDDGSPVASFPVDDELALAVPVSYAAKGAYNVSVRGYNIRQELTAHISFPIKVHIIIRDFTLVVDSPRPMPPGEFIFVVTPHVNHVPLEQVFAWDFTDGNTTEEADVVFDEIAVPVGHNTPHVFSWEAGSFINTTVTLNISNPISYQLLEAEIEMIEMVDNVTVLPVKHVELTDTNVQINIRLEHGSHVSYTIDYSDGTPADSTPFDVTLADKFNKDTQFVHTFAQPGDYFVTATASNAFSSVPASNVIPIEIHIPIRDFTLVSNSPQPIPPGDIVFTVTPHVDHIPLEQVLTWSFPNGNITSEADFVFAAPVGHDTPHTFIWPPGTTSNVTVNLNISNPVSFQLLDVEVTMIEQVAEITVSPVKAVALTDEDVQIDVNLGYGSHVSYTCNYGDGTTEDAVPFDATSMDVFNKGTQFVHAFTEPGEYFVTVTASNDFGSVDGTNDIGIAVHIPIRDFTLVSNSPQPIPPGDFVFTVTPHVDHIPLEQVLTWNFGDETFPVEADIVFDPISPVGHPTQHTYTWPQGTVSNITVGLNVSNPVSFQLLDVEITLVEMIQDVTVTPLKFMEATFIDVTINVQIGSGSHVTYTADFGDGTADDNKPFDATSPSVFNSREQFVHSYDLPGKYFVTVTASNQFSEDTGTHRIPIHIQNTVYDLTLSSNTPVLTPPGNILYTLDTSPDPIPPPTNVTCTWVYDDGGDDSRYHETLTMPMADVPHSYKPTAKTIKPELNSVVTCQNNVSTYTTDAVVVIDANIVILEAVIPDDPKEMKKAIDLIVYITNYGYDPCFRYDVIMEEDGSHQITAVFGREECKTMPGFEVHDEFYLQEEERDNLVFSPKFNDGAVYVVTVMAENSISRDEVSAKFFILPGRCSRPDVSVGLEGLDPENPREVMRQLPFSIHGLINIDCYMEYALISDWKVEKNTSEGYQIIDYLTPTSFDLNVDALSLPVGDYHVTLIGSLDVNFFVKGKKKLIDGGQDMFLRIIPAPLEVRIAGGDEVVKGKFGDLTLMALLNDRENPGNTSGVTLKWSCKVTPEPTLVASPDWNSIPDFGFDMGDCFPRGSSWELNSTKLIVPQETLAHEKGTAPANYTISVWAARDNRFAEHTQWVTFEVGADLDLDIVCHGYNCKSLINDEATLMVRGKCLNCIPGDDIIFSWSVEEETRRGSDEFDEIQLNHTGYTDVPGFVSKADIPPDSLIPGLFYKIMISAVASDGRFGLSKATFLINQAPYGGVCETVEEDLWTAGLNLILRELKLHDEVDNFMEAGVNTWNVLDMSDARLEELGVPLRGRRIALRDRSREYNDYILNDKTRFKKHKVSCVDWKDDTLVTTTERRRRKRDAEGSTFLPLEYEMVASGQLLFFARQPESSYMPLIPEPGNNGTILIGATIRDEFWTAGEDEMLLELDDINNKTDVAIEMAEKVKILADAGDIRSTMQMTLALVTLESRQLYPSWLTVSPDNMTMMYGGIGSDEANITEKKDLFFDETRIPFHGFLIDQIAKLNPRFPREILSIISVMKVLVTGPEFFMDNSVKKVVDIMDTLVDGLVTQAEFTDPALIDQICTDINSITGSMLDIVATEGRAKYDECSRSCDKEEMKGEIRKVVKKATGVFQKSADLQVANKLPGEPFIMQEEEAFTLIAGKKRADDVSAMVIGGAKGSTHFPGKNKFIADVEPDDCLQFMHLAFKNNPYMWHQSADSVNSPVQQTNAKGCDLPEEKRFLEMPSDDPYRVHVPVLPMPPNMTFTVVNDTTTELVLHFFETRDPTEYVQLFFDPSVKNMSFELFIGYDRTPDNVDFDYNVTLPILPDDFDLDDPEAIENLTTPFSIILPQNLTSQLGNFTVATWIKVGGEAIGLTNYTFHIQYIKSRLFEWEDESWESRGSEVEPETTAAEVRFKSTIFADSLGAGLFIGPNTIDFGSVFDNFGAKLVENMHVVVCVVLMILVFIGLTPVARHLDKLDCAMITPAHIFPPNANMSNNEALPYQYHVDVYTGLSRDSGTGSKVFIDILGTKSTTGILPLESSDRKNFKMGDMNSFLATSPIPLGKLSYIRIFHDNSGNGGKASWFCDKVVITERHSRKKYLFLIGKWFSVSKGDFKIDRTIPIATREQLLSFKSLFPRRSKKFLTNDHLWISIFYKESGEKFTRVQRLACAVAAVFMTMIADAMWYQRDESEGKKEGFQIGPLAFTLQALWVSVCSVLTVIPVTFVIVFFFKRSKIKLTEAEQKAKELDEEFFAQMDARDKASKDKQEASQDGASGSQDQLSQEDKDFLEKTKKKQKGDGRFLPYWCKYIAWVLVFLVIVLASFFSILYSFEWGGEKSKGWLTAFLLSFTESEFLVSPVKAIVLAVIFSLFFKKLLDDDIEDEEEDEYANAVCRDDDDNGPTPLTREQVHEARRKFDLERRLKDAMRTLVYHVVFLIVLILVTYGNRDSDSFRQNETMRDHFIRNVQYTLINSEGPFYDWMEQVVIPRLYMTDYNNWDPVVKKKDLRYTEDSMCYRLGPPQLRQYRIRPDLCSPVLHNFNITCNVDYMHGTKSDGDYALGWDRLTGNETVDELDGAYVYRNDQDDDTSYWGWLTSYRGGGYIANLGTTQEMAFENLDKLKEYAWFDRYTRALVLEFNAYNANSNLFTMVSLIFELPSYGSAVPREEIKTVKMYRYFGPWGVFALATEIILILIIIFLFVKLIYNVSKQGCRGYFHEFWHRIELGKVVFTVIAFIFYITRTLFIKSTVEEMMNNRGKVVSFADVVRVDEVFINMIGAALFMQILQLLWVLQFNKSLAELSATISQSWKSLRSFFVTLVIIFMAFAMVAYHIYGTMLWNYRDFMHTIYAQLISVLGKFDTNEIVTVGGDFGRLIFMGYQLVMLFIFLNMLVAILNDTIADVNSGAVYVKYEDEVIDLLIEKLGWGKKKKVTIAEPEKKENDKGP